MRHRAGESVNLDSVPKLNAFAFF